MMIIQIAPAIKRLLLTRVGCWNNLVLDFNPSLNIITGRGCVGKSTILRSILHAVRPLGSDGYCLTPTYPFTSGRIGIEFYTQSVIVDIPAFNRISEERAIDESYGQFMLSQLRSCTTGTPQGLALLIEDEVTTSLDIIQYHQAVELLNNATGQTICIISCCEFSLKDFPNARVYNIYMDTEDIAHIELIRQSGGHMSKPFHEIENDDDMDFLNVPTTQPNPVAPPSGRLVVKRVGHSITRQIPKPIVLVDTRERYPFDFSRFPNWIADEKRQALKAGDYSVEGMEKLLVLERKTLTDLISTVIQQRIRFFKECEKMALYRWRALLIEASYEDIKSPYDEDYNTSAHPNAVSGTLDALEARYGIPVIYTSRYRPLAEEKAASWLSKHFTYWYLETNGFGRVLQEGDL